MRADWCTPGPSTLHVTLMPPGPCIAGVTFPSRTHQLLFQHRSSVQGLMSPGTPLQTFLSMFLGYSGYFQ